MNLNYKQLAVIGILILAFLAGVWYLLTQPAFATNKVTICHYTGNGNYQKISVDDDAVNGQGNGDHNSSNHQQGKDIIPAGYWDQNGRNWDTQGKARWNNNCNTPVTPTPTPTVTPTPTEEPNPCDEVPSKEAILKDNPCEEPTPTPTPVPGNPPSFAGSSTDAPVCTDGSTTQLVGNLHVVRNGSLATVNFFITEGEHANIYWRENSSSTWQHAVSGVIGNSDKYVSYPIGDLNPVGDYTFGVQQTKGCGSGELATAVVIDDYHPQTFRLSYWTF